MRIIFTLFNIISFLATSCSFAQVSQHNENMDDCDKVQSFFNTLEEFRGPLINDNAYQCKNMYLLNGFNAGRVIVPGKEGKFWTVNMNTEDLQQIEAETKYLELIHQLMKCIYLNSWKAGETFIGDDIYHYNFKQSISNTDYYKSILVSYYKLKNSELYRVEITLKN